MDLIKLFLVSTTLCFGPMMMMMMIMIEVTQGHSVPSALSRTKNLSCYFCHTLTHGEMCQQPYYNIQMVPTELQVRQCTKKDRHCIVRRHSYTLNNSDVKVWMMERDCSQSCTNECVTSLITGDKMKLHLCTSCCQQNLCNVGNGGTNNNITLNKIITLIMVTLLTLIAFLCLSLK